MKEVTPQPPTSALRKPPPLPARLVDLRPPVLIGSGLWFLAFVGFLVARLGFHLGPMTWLWACLAGWLLGPLGLVIVHWQRRAARRGSRSAQRGIG